MSEDNEEQAGTSCCASCGIAEIDDVKLKDCDGCDLVRYCSDECRENHRSEHEEACKKRAAELRDEQLYKQPESSHLGDCPICCLPLPLDLMKSTLTGCCSKLICTGCFYANQMRELEQNLATKCTFCREALSKTEEEHFKRLMRRIEKNDPYAIYQQGAEQYDKGDYRSAFEYWKKATDLGNVDAHHRLAGLYIFGKGVEQEEGKIIHHLEEAAIAGHPEARYNIGYHKWNNGDKEGAVKHWIIAATLGEDDSTKMLMKAFKEGHVSKEDYAAALRAHKAAVDATKSPQRDIAEKFVAIYREGGKQH